MVHKKSDAILIKISVGHLDNSEWSASHNTLNSVCEFLTLDLNIISFCSFSL